MTNVGHLRSREIFSINHHQPTTSSSAGSSCNLSELAATPSHCKVVQLQSRSPPCAAFAGGLPNIDRLQARALAVSVQLCSESERPKMPDAATLQRQFNAVCYFLAIVYVAMGLWCAVQLIRFALVSRVWTRQKIAHVLVFLLCASRAAFFCVVPGWGASLFYTTLSGGIRKAWLVVLNELPSLLIISTFSMQLLMWADSYHSGAHSLQTFKWRVRPTILGINAALYVIQVRRPLARRLEYRPVPHPLNSQIAVWAGYESTETYLALELSVACAALHATVFVILAAFLGCYARLIITQHGRTAGIPLRVRQRQTCTIAGASTPISIAFVVRAIAILIAAACEWRSAASVSVLSSSKLQVELEWRLQRMPVGSPVAHAFAVLL